MFSATTTPSTRHFSDARARLVLFVLHFKVIITFLFFLQTALSVNITTTQAFCVISQCLGQIRQAPVFLGRRRRKREVFDPFTNQWLQKSMPENENNQTNLMAADQFIIVKSVLVDIVTNEDEDNL